METTSIRINAQTAAAHFDGMSRGIICEELEILLLNAAAVRARVSWMTTHFTVEVETAQLMDAASTLDAVNLL